MALFPQWLRRFFRRFIPLDKSDDCGYGAFSLPSDHPFTRACRLHDIPFADAIEGKEEHPLDHEDWMLFWRWVLIARAEPNIEKRMDLVWDIIKLFPLARVGGQILWPGRK